MKDKMSIDELIEKVKELEKSFQKKVYNRVVLPSEEYEEFKKEIKKGEDNLSNVLGISVKFNSSLPKGWYALESGNKLMLVNPKGEYGILEKPNVDWNFKPTSSWME